MDRKQERRTQDCAFLVLSPIYKSDQVAAVAVVGNSGHSNLVIVNVLHIFNGPRWTQTGIKASLSVSSAQ